MPVSLLTPVTLSTKYTDAATLGPFETLEKIDFTITGGVVAYQVAKLNKQTGKPYFDQSEAYSPPGTFGLDECYGIRFRSRDAISLATLDPVVGWFDDDPDPYAPGNVPAGASVLLSTLNIQHNDAAVATEPTLDFEDSATVTWAVTDDPVNTRVKVTPTVIGPVISVFGRTGAVVAVTGDYTAAQVTNAADKASASAQVFSGALSTGPTTQAFNGAQINGAFIGTNGQIVSFNAVASDFLQAGLNADTFAEFKINNHGLFQWGPGNAATDVTLQRVAAGRLQLGTTTPQQGRLDIVGSATGNTNFTVYVSGDTNTRLLVTSDGILKWGSGTAAPDCNLQRIAAGLIGDTATALTTGPVLGGFTGAQTAGTLINSGSSPVRTFLTTATNTAYTVGLTTDTSNAGRFNFDGNGTHKWGPGVAAATDCTLKRTNVSRMQFGDTGETCRVDVQSQAVTDVIFSTFVQGDTQVRFDILADGTMKWGPGGATATDVNLTRSAANVLNLGTTGQRGALQLFASATTDAELSVFVTTDANARLSIRGDGRHTWGPGNAAGDTIAQRGAAGIFDISPGTSGGMIWKAAATHTGSNDTLTPSGTNEWETHITNVSGATTLTIAAPTQEPPAATATATMFIKIKNTGASGAVTLTWNAVYVANSVALPTSVNFGTYKVMQFQWDPDVSKWDLIAVA